MEKVASIIKYKNDREKAIHWMATLPKRYNPYELKVLLDDVRKGDFLLWTEEGGIKIL